MHCIFPVIPAEAGIQRVSGYRIKSGMTAKTTCQRLLQQSHKGGKRTKL
jgi:hypothetical protein